MPFKNVFDPSLDALITEVEREQIGLLISLGIESGYLIQVGPSEVEPTPLGQTFVDGWLNDPNLPKPDGYQGDNWDHVGMILALVMVESDGE